MKSNQTFITIAIGVAFVTVAVLSRLLPHPMNFTPLAAIALFGGVYFSRRFAIVVPLIALLISDAVIGFYGAMPWVYAGFIAAGLIGMWLRNHKTPLFVAGGTLASSIIFYLLTNFGVWATGTMYVHNWAGLMECYVAAIPYFRSSLAGDAIFVAAMFGLYELTVALLRRQMQQVTAEKVSDNR
jgi:hypothetical protein